jgi:predicted nucleotidyltransferase
MNRERPAIPKEVIENFCRRHHIKKLALFGSYLRDDFGPESDIDFLVEFDPSHIPTLFDVAGMEIELSELLNGRKVDLRTPQDLSRYFRDEVIAQAEVQYAEG